MSRAFVLRASPLLVLLIGLGVAAQPPRNGDGGIATRAELNAPSAIAVDRDGNLFVYEALGGAVRRIDAASHVITTVVKVCDPSWNVPRLVGCVGHVSALLSDRPGSLLIAEFTYNRLERLDLGTGALSLVAGNGEIRSNGDGLPAREAGVSVSYCFAFDSLGNLLICDSGYRIRQVSAEKGVISTVAGSGRRGYGGDGGSALDAALTIPLGIAVDRSDNIYFVDDSSNRIRRVDRTTGVVDTFAGSGPPSTGSFFQVEFCCEAAQATRARFTSPRSLAFGPDGSLLFVLSGRICKIDASGSLRTIAGTGVDGFSGDGGLATKAKIGPASIAVDGQGNIFIAEFENNRIRRVDAKTGIITTVAGNGLPHRPPPVSM